MAKTPPKTHVTEANLMRAYFRECGRLEPLYPHAFSQTGGPNRTYVLSIEDGVLMARGRGESLGEMELARFIGRRGQEDVHDENGAGGTLLMNGNGFTDPILQVIQARMRDRARDMGHHARRTLLIPYDALEGAQVDKGTIQRVFANGETWQAETIVVPHIKNLGNHRTSTTFTFEGTNFIVRRERSWGETRATLTALVQPPNGNARWFTVNRTKTGSSVSVPVHVLGASCFTATGPDGERNHYLSAFDSRENPPLYFLAQLPPGSPKNYVQAIALLAPPIVHAARAQGKRVLRHGDIFFIQVDKLPDNAKILDAAANPATSRRIYGTTHVASGIARTPEGVTFARGMVRHRPELETPGRRPEHRDLTLNTGLWFLCVRNTVPKSTVTPTTRRRTTRVRNPRS